VIKVTTLAPDGPGSLNEALAASGPRIITFDVSGVIEAPEFLIAQGDVTIAGQSAPGAGVTLAGRLKGAYDYDVGNIIIRHVRVRPRYDGSDVSQFDAIQLARNHHLMLDHVSAAFAVDETIDLFESHDVTVQWSSIETVDDADNPTDRFIRGIVGSASSRRISVHHSLCTHNRGSCVALAGGPAELVSAHFYDVRAPFSHSDAASGPFSFVGNTFREGPNVTLLPFVFDDESAEPASDLAYYLSDNALSGATELCPAGNVDDPWSCNYDVGRDASFRVSAPFDFSTSAPEWIPVDASSSADTTNLVLDGAGAFPRDIVTRTAVADARAGVGSLDSPYPSDLSSMLVATTAPPDSDGDGIPDDWERLHGLDPANADDANSILGSGYPAIDQFLNELAAALVE
jgi:hypothetical protein